MRHLCQWAILAENRWAHYGRKLTAFKERHGVHLSDSTIWTWMDEEGFQWKRQQSWFHDAEKHDPEFVEKRGA
jgi:transposase